MRSCDEGALTTDAEVEPWEVHSELVLVSPEVCRRALELMPERDPDAFLARPKQPSVAASGLIDQHAATPSLPLAVAVHVLWRIGQTARSGLLAAGLVITLVYLAELLR